MARLTGEQLKDSYQNLLTIDATIESDPLTGQLENGLGNAITALGIGTDSPNANLHLSGTTDIGMRIKAGASALSYIDFDDADSGTPSGSIAYNHINDSMTFATGGSNTERMRIDSGGDISFRDGATNEAFYWDASEASLGIGNTSPASFLSGANVAVDVGNSSGGEFIARRTGGEANLAMGVTGGNIGYLYSTTNTPMVFGTNNAEAMRIDSSGNVTITTGNLILDSGAGIDFSDTPNSSGTMTSELLDDYEEGTWTPVVRGSGTAGTYELASNQSYYTKIGRMVTLHLSLVLDDPITGGGSGYVQISGLPFAKADTHNVVGTVRSTGFDYTGDYLITGFTTSGTTSTVLGIFGNQDNAGVSLPDISGLSAGDSLIINVSYLT